VTTRTTRGPDQRRPPGGRNPGAGRRLVAAGAGRAVLFAVLWAVFTGHPVESWTYGLPAIALAVPLSLTLAPPRRAGWMALRTVALLPMLAWISVRGGVDVARRALSPRLPVDPGVIEYRLRHPRPGIAVALGYAATVVPGTLALDVHDDRLLVHVIDCALPNDAALARLETWIAWALP